MQTVGDMLKSTVSSVVEITGRIEVAISDATDMIANAEAREIFEKTRRYLTILLQVFRRVYIDAEINLGHMLDARQMQEVEIAIDELCIVLRTIVDFINGIKTVDDIWESVEQSIESSEIYTAIIMDGWRARGVKRLLWSDGGREQKRQCL